MKTKIRELEKFRAATVVSLGEKSKKVNVKMNKDVSKEVIVELVKESMPKKDLKSPEIKSNFDKDSKAKETFVYDTKKMKEEVLTKCFLILGTKNKNHDNQKVYDIDKIPDEKVKKYFVDRNKKAKKKTEEIYVRNYIDDERNIKLERIKQLEEFNKIIFNMLSKTIPDKKNAKHIMKLPNEKMTAPFIEYSEKLNGKIFEDYEQFEKTSMEVRLKARLRKWDNTPRGFRLLNELFLYLVDGKPCDKALKTKLIEIHNAFIRKNVCSKEMKNKYVSKHDKKSREETVEKRLLHENYFYYGIKNDKKIKQEVLEELIRLPEEEISEIIKKEIISGYSLEKLVKRVLGQSEEEKISKGKTIKIIKEHYIQHVRTTETLSNTKKFMLCEIHKYMKGRFRKIKENKNNEDVSVLIEHTFSFRRLENKITNHIRNKIRTYTFYKGRHENHFRNKIRTYTFYKGRHENHFELNNYKYSTDALILLHSEETFFKSLNSAISLIRLALTNRLRRVRPHLALDYIGINHFKKDNSKFYKLTDENHHLWYDLSDKIQDAKSAKVDLIETISRIRDFRNDVCHFGCNIQEAFTPENKKSFDIERLVRNYSFGFLRKVYNNNIHLVFKKEIYCKFINDYYSSSLEDTSSYLPRPHKIMNSYKTSLKEDGKTDCEYLETFDERHSQAQKYMLKMIYYGSFQKQFMDNFKTYRMKYDTQKSVRYHNKIVDDSLSDAYRNLQSSISKGSATIRKWIDFVAFCFKEYMVKEEIKVYNEALDKNNGDDIFKRIIKSFRGVKIDLVNDFEKASFILSSARFLRKRDLSQLKHSFEKLISTYSKIIDNKKLESDKIKNVESNQAILKQNVLIIKLLLGSDFMEPLTYSNIDYEKINESEWLKLVKRDYSINNKNLEKAIELEKKANKEIFKHIDCFSRQDATIKKYDSNNEAVDVYLYDQGNLGNIVVHKHLIEAYRIGFLDSITNYLKGKEVKKDLGVHLEKYSELSERRTKNKKELDYEFKEFSKKIKKYKHQRGNTKNIVKESSKAAKESLDNNNRYVFYKNYFEGAYVTTLSNIIIDIWSRFSARYYQLERDYYYLSNAEGSEKTKCEKVFKKETKLKKFLNFNSKEGKGIENETRNDFLHGNFFQTRDNYNAKTLNELMEMSYKDFEYNTALRNNHNQIVPFIMDKYFVEAVYNRKDKKFEMKLKELFFGYKDSEKRKELGLCGFALKDPLHLTIVEGILDYKASEFILSQKEV